MGFETKTLPCWECRVPISVTVPKTSVIGATLGHAVPRRCGGVGDGHWPDSKSAARMLAVDDWAKRKEKAYGTIRNRPQAVSGSGLVTGAHCRVIDGLAARAFRRFTYFYHRS